MPTLPKGKKRSWITSRPTQARQMDNSAFYHSRGWRMTRKFYIKANPLCEQCTRDGRTTGRSYKTNNIRWLNAASF